jgi:nucleotide-binding universal stress UspA family protein
VQQGAWRADHSTDPEDTVIAFSMVVCPTDLSDLTRPALAHAAQLARWYGARISVLHVLPEAPEERASLSEAAALPPSAAGPPMRMVDAVRASVAELLDGIEFTVRVVAGKPAPRIVEHAREIGADLIVMSTHGRSGFDHLVHGSVTERVLAHATCPVLTVPPHATTAPHALFRQILCPMDFSPASRRACDVALDLARQANGVLHLLHAIEWYPEGETISGGRLDLEGFRQGLREQASARLAGVMGLVDASWADVRPIVAVGRPYRRILEHADTHDVDLIVMGAQGSAGLDLAVFGSVTRQVLAQARAPVLITRGTL